MSKKNKPKKTYLFEQVLDLLKGNSGKALNYKQISAGLELNTDPERLMVIEVLEALLAQQMVIETERGRFMVKETKTYLSGVIDFTASGSAYVTVKEFENDFFITEKKTKDALQGDLVKIYVYPGGKRDKKEAEVVDVIKRAKTTFVGTLQVLPKFAFLVPENHKLHVDFFVPLEKIKEAKNGQKVQVQLTEWKKGDANPTAEVIEIFGYPGEHKTEINAIMAEYGLPPEFPQEVEMAAKKIDTEIRKEEIEKRRDFRHITTFTIDPIDAKDFDDALSFKKLENGNYEIGVHIADVTHYLKPGSILDHEAINRATSVYLVDRVIPMLPEVLSNFVCSLRPMEEKYCFSAVFELDIEANILHEWYGKTIIFSNRRFTYEEAQLIIETEEGDFVEEILTLDKLAKKLRSQRTKKGSIFFDKEEVKFHLDEEGNPLGVYFKVQKDAHKLIEDFMLLANRKVAELITKKGKNEGEKANLKTEKKNHPEKQKSSAVYRVHDVPSEEKLSSLSQFVSRFGYAISTKDKKGTVHSLNKLLSDIKGKREAGMIELLTLRSMPKALYTTHNIGHYGLGFEFYTHFTSPIRRYPDVLVHRLLEAYLNKEQYSSPDELEMMCKHSSEMERLAAEAERASVKFKQVEFMEDKVGLTFTGIISGVTDWGIYVEIIENKCEGMIRVRDLRDDHYYFDEDNFRYVARRSGKVYALGDQIEIEVKKADVLKKQLDFIFAKPGNEVTIQQVGKKSISGKRKK